MTKNISVKRQGSQEAQRLSRCGGLYLLQRCHSSSIENY